MLLSLALALLGARLCASLRPPPHPLGDSALLARRAPASNDPISRFFGAFLPTPEDLGLARFNRSTRPENYYCTTDEWAAPLACDLDPDAALVRQTLRYTNLETRALRLVYSAEEHGWNAASFHSRVDRLGPAVVLARTVSGGVVGGYNPTGWVNYGEHRGSVAAFLFTFAGGDLAQRPIKVDDGSGPRFGAEGLTILLARDKPRQVRSKLGLYYDRLPSGVNSLLPGGLPVDELADLRVFVGVYAPDERVPYSDALPFSLN